MANIDPNEFPWEIETVASIDPKEFPWEGSSTIYDEKTLCLDLDQSPMGLYKGRYEMNSCTVNVMIRKGRDVNRETYDLLRAFRHDNAIGFLDIYNEVKQGVHLCLVIPEVRCTFKKWLELEGHSLLFDDKGHMTPLLFNMMSDFADLICSLQKKQLSVENFTMDNIYMSALVYSPVKICILLVEVRKLPILGAVNKKQNWDYVRNFLNYCERQCGVERDGATKSLCNFLGSTDFTMEKLRRYPHDWDWERKGEYLIALVAGQHSFRKNLLIDKVDWPFQSKARRYDSLPGEIQLLIDWEERENGPVSILDYMGYITLLRNCFKHHQKLSNEIKNFVPNQKSIIEMIECYNPQFWITIYEIVGWP